MQRRSPYRPLRLAPLVVALIPLLAMHLGCSAPRRTWAPAQDPSQLDDTAYLHYLATVPTVTVEEGTRAMLLLIGRYEMGSTHEQNWYALLELGAVRSEWKLDAGDTLDKGTLAYMLSALAKLPPGLNDLCARWTGLADRRYALRNGVYYGIMPYGLPHEPVTGGELIAALAAVEPRIGETPPCNP